MKELSEYWQMRIFDLLEGNLTEKEKKEVLQEIEKNAALNQEYNMMRKTYLEPDHIVFSNKNSLYKKQHGAFTVIFTKRFAAAAAIAILFGSLSVFWFAGNHADSSVNTVSKTQNLPQNPKINIPDSEKNSTVKIKSNSLPEWSNSKNNTNQNIVPEIGPDLNQPTPNNKVIEPIVVAQQVPVDTAIHIVPALVIADPEKKKTDDTSLATDPNTPRIDYHKKRSLGYKLLNNGKIMLATLVMPTVKFKTEKKTNKLIPRVKMEISTPKTEIIATLID